MKLIDAERLITALIYFRNEKDVDGFPMHTMSEKLRIDRCIEIIAEQPTVEKPKGEWIKNNYRMVKRLDTDKSELVFDCTCSICRYTTGKHALKFSICPVCGSEMEVKNDN